ncbi:MAG: hypothetical protein IJ675_00405 [Pseudobutyrivibrio sp.]|nr:hypothetical protein [Pseudobutyrivibrio sp.]
MGLFENIFGKKENKVEKHSEFVMGVEDIFHLKDSKELVVVGRLKGTVRPGDAVLVEIPTQPLQKR